MVVEQARLGLESFGYRIEACRGSSEALEIFRASPDRFDLIITDQTMPDMTGLELSRELMLIRPSVPIILCTGFSELVNESTARAAGVRSYVKKPVLPRSLAAEIRKIVDASRAG
jgi:CheY-like chemotaxis protein